MIALVVAVFSVEQVHGGIDPWHAEVRRKMGAVTHHIVEPDVKVVLDVEPLVVREELTEG